jgi:hypothetical protein
MLIIQAAAVIHRDGWCGEVADVQDIGMLDDATYLCSELRDEGGASLALAMEDQLPVSASELVVRSQRMCQGRVSGTGTPAPLNVVVHQGEHQLLAETITPGGSWREHRFGIPAVSEGGPLTVQLLVPAGERQVAVSRLRIEARELVSAAPVEVPACDTQPAAIEQPVVADDLVAEPLDPDAVAAAVEDSAACPVVSPPVKTRKRARHRDGTYHGDNPATAGVNEAWVEE